jgi:hypothetical protein
MRLNMEKDKKSKKLTDVINAIDNIDSWNDEFKSGEITQLELSNMFLELALTK